MDNCVFADFLVGALLAAAFVYFFVMPKIKASRDKKQGGGGKPGDNQQPK